MPNFICILPFKSEYFDETWALGDPISEEDHQKLSWEEQGYFREKEIEEEEKEEDFLKNNFPGLAGEI